MSVKMKRLTSLLGQPSRRMDSSGDNENNDSAAQDAAESRSRKSSITTQHTSQTRDSTVEPYPKAASVTTDSVTLVSPDLDDVVYSKLIEHGSQLTEDPDAGKQFLTDFGRLKEGTDVSLRFRALANTIYPDGPHSLLPLVSVWIPMWYRFAVQRRRADKLSRDAEYKEQDDFNWLLRYIEDYISLGHDHFDEEELAQLCGSLNQVCQETGRQGVIIHSIVIYQKILRETVFPQSALPTTLEVLCASTVNLTESPLELSYCFDLFLASPLSDQVADWMLECITAPTVQNNSFRLIEARGAIRQARHHLNVTGKSGQYAIAMQQFLERLNQASKCCIFRYCTEILLACQSVLESDQIQVLLDTDLRTFIGTIENCTRTMLFKSGSSKSLETLRSPDRAQIAESQRQNEKHLAERKVAVRQLLAAFETIWTKLNITQARLISDFFMEHAKDLNDAQAASVISYLSSNGLLLPGADDWSQRGTKVFDSFVRNTRVSAEQRINAALACINAAAAAVTSTAQSTGESRESTLAAGKNSVDRLLNMLGKEYNTSVVRGTLKHLKDLSDCVDSEGKSQYAGLIIEKSLYFVRTERSAEDEISDEHVLLFTQAIRDIFLRALQKNGGVAVKAYNALLEIASARCKSRRCRLAALRLLLRIRSDSDSFVYTTTAYDSEYIAAALCRTEQTRDAYAKEMSVHQRASASHMTGTSHSLSARQLWVYPKEDSCMLGWDSSTSRYVTISGAKLAGEDHAELNMTSWLVTIIESLQSDSDWETYSFILVHLGAQLFNVKLFSTSLQAVVMLRQVLCEQVHNNSFREPPLVTGLRKSDAALCMFNMLTSLIPYAAIKSEKIQKGFGDDLVKAFLTGIGNTWDGTHRGCIHALSVCSFEIPASVASSYPSIVQMMGKNMSQSHLTIHILEFLAQVARLPEVHSSFNENEITQIFGICLQFLEKTRETYSSNLNTSSPRSATPARHSGLSLRRPPFRAAIVQDTALPHYASALAYHTIIHWFLSLRLEIRARYVSWIVPRLVLKGSKGEESIDEQGQVLIDMMQRTAYSDLGESIPNPTFAKDSDGTISSSSWIVGLSIITAETAGHTGLTQITKRQAAGTTYTLYQQLTAPTASHQAPLVTQLRPEEISRFGTTDMLPSHIILQMTTTAAPISVDEQPIYLPSEDFVTRALNVFDRIPTVDSHKIGVMYVGHGQSKESDYLANTSTSPDFERFLYGLGYRVSLEPPLRFNPQGLQFPRDGNLTMAWRDRVSEVVYHVPSMMPNNLEEDAHCNIKKSHVGNCHVVVIFNESGLEWDTNNFTSAVTLVQVIITPVSRMSIKEEPALEPNQAEAISQEISSTTTADIGPSDFYQVVVVTKENYPNVSPAADPKVISKEMLPAFVRMFSINANLFSQARVAADSNDEEFPSSWRARLQAIKRLKERVTAKNNGPSRNHSIASDRHAISSGRRTPASREEQQGGDGDGALAQQLDFGNWTSSTEKD